MAARPVLGFLPRQTLRQTFSRPRNLHTPSPRPQPTQPFRRAQPLPRRHASTFQRFAVDARALFRQNPFSVTAASICILVGIGMLAYANYLYSSYIIQAFHNYPEPVAQKLRRALYYTNTDLQPKEAVKYYKQALQIAEEIGMDPFSDEIMGVKIQVASLMEKIRHVGKAAQVLEILRADSLEWMRIYGGEAHNRVKRTRVLAKVVGMSVKLGELYGSAEVYDREMAEERLVWAVETVLKERQRRESVREIEGLSEEELEERYGRWMSGSETGAALEALAHKYDERGQHYLAAPLFLQALSLYPTKDCHTVVLMNNLASALAQQSPRFASAVQSYAAANTISNSPSGAQPSAPPATRESMIQNGAMWAQKALDVSGSITPPDRTEECDVGCAVALHNLGEFAEMMGQKDMARRKYKEAVSLARAVGFAEGVEESAERLRALG